MELPLIKTAADLPTLMPRWKSTLDPLLAGPLARARVIENVAVVSGVNVVNHGLGRKLTGYVVILSTAAATFYDLQSTNPTTALTLELVASAPAVVSLLVF